AGSPLPRRQAARSSVSFCAATWDDDVIDLVQVTTSGQRLIPPAIALQRLHITYLVPHLRYLIVVSEDPFPRAGVMCRPNSLRKGGTLPVKGEQSLVSLLEPANFGDARPPLLAAIRRCRYEFQRLGLNCQFEGGRSPLMLSLKIAGDSSLFKASPGLGAKHRWRPHDARLHLGIVRQGSAH